MVILKIILVFTQAKSSKTMVLPNFWCNFTACVVINCNAKIGRKTNRNSNRSGS